MGVWHNNDPEFCQGTHRHIYPLYFSRLIFLFRAWDIYVGCIVHELVT